MGLELLKRILGMLFLTVFLMPAKMVLAQEGAEEEEPQEIYPVIYEEWTGRSEAVMELTEEEQEYRVLPGDCLWNISGKLWGEGKWYDRLLTADGASGAEG